MIAIDTNILVRLFINDDMVQSKLANNFIQDQELSGNLILITNIVLVELVWVLKRGYEVSKNDIIKTLKMLISNEMFQFENRSSIIKTIQKYSKNSGDFADYLIGITSQIFNATTTYTFDKKSGKDDLFTLLK